MISRIYIEQAVADHPVARAVCERFNDKPQVMIERYGEVFNRKAQNFRLQKRAPGLILAEKFQRHVLPTPPGYGIGHAHNFYVSHMLNCVYDCRYCFLQGMYRSAHYVLFVNYDDFKSAMAEQLTELPEEASACFFSGYDCDSLALEPVSGYVADLLPFFQQHPNAWLELRTKSTQVRTLLQPDTAALANVVVAYSLSPTQTTAELEHKTPSLTRRLATLARLGAHGWPLGLRFDPLIYSDDYRDRYRELFRQTFAAIDLGSVALHSVTLGPFRLPRGFYQRIQKLYPDEPLFARALEERNGLVSYPSEIEHEMRAFCTEELLRYLPAQTLFPCEF